MPQPRNPQTGEGQAGSRSQAQPPKEETPSREQGVQHIDDDQDTEMDTRERRFDARQHAVADPVNPEGEEEVYATGTGGLSPDALELAATIDKELPRRSQLLAFRDLLDQLIGRTGQVPEQPRVPLVQSAAGLPPVLDDDGNEDRSGGLDHRAAAKAADLEPELLLDYAVRQDRTPLGEPLGPRVLRFVRADGSKDAVTLEK